jgi:hypothetical protein
VRDGFVPVAFFFAEDEKMLYRQGGSLRAAAATACDNENEEYSS